MSNKNELTLPMPNPELASSNYGFPLAYRDIYDFEEARKRIESWHEQMVRETKPFSIDDLNKMQYGQCLENLRAIYGFETTGWDNKLCYITFTRTVERGETHEVILEDEEPEWLIFSCLKNSMKDWNGYMVDEQYPLTLGECRLFIELIAILKRMYPNNN